MLHIPCYTDIRMIPFSLFCISQICPDYNLHNYQKSVSTRQIHCYCYITVIAIVSKISLIQSFPLIMAINNEMKSNFGNFIKNLF